MPADPLFSLPETLEKILSTSGIRIPRARRKIFREEVSIAIAEFHSERRRPQFTIPRHQLNDQLKNVLNRINALDNTLKQSRAAEDVMVRVRWPREDLPTLVTSPTRRPYFSGLVQELKMATEKALKHRGPLPYVVESRGLVAENAFIGRLLASWSQTLGKVPTFAESSPFVRLVCVCFEHVGVRYQQPSAVAKRCARIFKSGKRRASGN